MSHKYQGEAPGEASEEHKAPPRTLRNRQPDGNTGEPPVRRSWRPCQMLNQDGEMNPHHHQHRHHHHPSASRGPHRHRPQPPTGHGQAQSPDLTPVIVSPMQDEGGSHSAEPHLVKHPRPAVTRYRRHGDPNPRLRGHKQRLPVKETQDSPPSVDIQEGPAEPEKPQVSSAEPVTDKSGDSASSHQTPVAVISPTHLSPDVTAHDMQPFTEQPPSADKDEEPQEVHFSECREEPEVIPEDVKQSKEMVDNENSPSTEGNSSLSCNIVEKPGENAEKEEEDEEEEDPEEEDQGVCNVEEDPAAQGSEITDLCSDTESAASLSMDGPLHSPPPLHSPTPPSSPDAPTYPQLDHFSEDNSTSPLPDSNPLPEDDEDCSESCSLAHITSGLESYPKTYAEFYTESHQKSYPEPSFESDLEPKPHPNSFPEPLKTCYPEAQNEPQRTESYTAHQVSRREPFHSRRPENVQKGTLPFPSERSHHSSRRGRNRGSQNLPPDRSVGCRLHHYDGQSDEECENSGSNQVPKSRRQATRPLDSQAKTVSSRQSSPREAQEEHEDEGAKNSGDAISLVIKDIKDAIEGVKTKTVRSPYTPDKPVEPIWVMRPDVSPTEDSNSLQNSTDHSSPQSPSASPSRFVLATVRDPVSPHRAEPTGAPNSTYHQQQPPSSRHLKQGHQSQPKDSATSWPTQSHTQPPTGATNVPRQQCQHQQNFPPQQPRNSAQPQVPPQKPSIQEIRRALPPFPTFVDLPGPCDPEDLIDGIIFAATYMGCTHLLSERTPSKSARMQQAQEAMSRVRAAQKQAKNRKKSPDGEAASTAEVDLFMSTQRIKVLNADTQESLMDLPLRTISYIADIGNMVVLMARGKMVRSRSAQENLNHSEEQSSMNPDDRRLYRMICHVFESEDAQLIAQSIGQSFSVAYQEFLRANGIDPEDLSQREYSDLLNTQDMYNDDLIHFSKSENCRDVYIEKQKGEILGVVIVESGWGSILPTVIIASLMHAGPAEKSGRLNIGDQIMTVNGTSLVGLPLSTCQSIIKGLKSQSRIKLNIVRCPPVTMVLIRRPDLRYQLGFSVQNGIICSLMRGGIAERGGVRVGHRIIEINSQSVVATPHEKIVQVLSNAMGEIHMKTMPAAMYRLLTAQEQPVYI
ncbi:amyloid-beta A4 precursor protein-binding family A member 1-like [Gouania willdenowi]|uniref:Amyloid-beta A4 precursor protein-binding family A member 1-like n=1 Tax=Gouania willdenowi TaxID=441366 RepID=A0A8C5GEJ8_GOUWI|nr:amyloid-beta A4 precursor protein-binding family A member 1-like [Gouania willdenowi]